MIPAALYSTVYLILVAILTAIAINKTQTYKFNGNATTSSIWPGYILAILLALFIGFRPMSGQYFVDMANYNVEYYALHYNRPFEFTSDTTNFIFDNLFKWLAHARYDITFFFVIIALIYFVLTYFAITKLFPGHAFIAYVVFLGAFSTFSYATNGIKAGAAATLFLCALAYWQDKYKAIFFLLLSLGFHHSMIVPIIAYVAAICVRESKFYFIFWVFSLLVAAAHISFFQVLFAGMADESGASYLTDTSGNWGGKSGFRLDFILYSALPVYIGYISIFKYHLRSNTYSILLNVYLLTNAVWMLCMYASFTNRIAYLSWLLYPVVAIYPFFCPTFMPEQQKKLKRVVWVQFLFTLFMNIIYYG